jgi:hypothetical protein
MRMRLAFAAAVTWLVATGSAGAVTIGQLEMTFQSGATFSGSVTFADGFSFADGSSVIGVTGSLNGYEYGTVGYVASGSDPISWVSDGPPFTSYLLDGPFTPAPCGELDPTYCNFIVFSYTSSGEVSLASSVNEGADPMSHGTITIESVASVPLHPSLSAQMLVLLLLGSLVAWRNRRRTQAFSSAI